MTWMPRQKAAGKAERPLLVGLWRRTWYREATGQQPFLVAEFPVSPQEEEMGRGGGGMRMIRLPALI